jgi:hypothetical protein
MQTREIAAIKDEVKSLSHEQKVELIKFLADTLTVEPDGSVPLPFGKYASAYRSMSSAEDFQIAEWRPADFDVANGDEQ